MAVQLKINCHKILAAFQNDVFQKAMGLQQQDLLLCVLRGLNISTMYIHRTFSHQSLIISSFESVKAYKVIYQKN